MNNSQVAHVWAQQRKPEGEGSNFYFNGTTIYSFGGHFPIARFTDRTLDGQRVVLFTIENGWGGYTGRHIHHVYGALRGLPVRIIDCLEPATRSGRHNSRVLTQEAQHFNNLEDYAERFSAALLKASRARKHAELYVQRAEQIREWCAAYCEAFNLPVPQWVTDEIPTDLAGIKARAQETARMENERKRAELAAKVAEWRNGNTVSIHEHPDTMLRLSRNGLKVETSRGAEVPVADARNLWRMVARCVATATGLKTPPPVSVGQFQLREIHADGTCIVGCHTLDYSETRAFASAQGWE
jgi:hypothetical protein